MSPQQNKMLINLLAQALDKKHHEVPTPGIFPRRLRDILQRIEIEYKGQKTYIVGEGYKSVWKFINCLKEQYPKANSLSNSTILLPLKEILVKILEGKCNYEESIRALADNLDSYIKEWEFWFPLDGITLKDLPCFKVGDVEFSEAKSQDLKRFAKPPFGDLRKKWERTIIAKTRCFGDFQGGEQKAREVVQEAINLLRLYTVVGAPPSLAHRHFQIYLKGSEPVGIENVVGIEVETSKITRQWGGHGKLQDVEISLELLKKFEECLLGEFSSLLS